MQVETIPIPRWINAPVAILWLLRDTDFFSSGIPLQLGDQFLNPGHILVFRLDPLEICVVLYQLPTKQAYVPLCLRFVRMHERIAPVKPLIVVQRTGRVCPSGSRLICKRLMDAWANISHYLSYKGNASIPEHLRRDFHALSGLFYVGDKHFELFYGEAVSSAKTVLAKAAAGNIDDDAVNLETVHALLRQLYPNRQEADLSEVSEFVEEITLVGYSSLEALKNALQEARAIGEADERADPPGHDKLPGTQYYDLGLARTSLKLKNHNYREVMEQRSKLRSFSRQSDTE